LSRIFITGMGLISAIGDSVEENRNSLQQAKTGISHIRYLETAWAGKLPSAEVRHKTDELNRKIFEQPDPSITRTSLLALHAACEAIRDSGLTSAELKSPETGLVGATTVGGMCLTDELYHDALAKENGTAYLSSYDYASVTMAIQKRFGIGGETATINTACSSSANAIIYGARLIRHGFARRAIVGGAESLAKFTINGFNALNILSSKPCAPFDRDRSGLNLGEGAAFLVLEKEDDLKGRKAYAELTGFGNKNDAYHPSSSSPEGLGPYLSMQDALSYSQLRAGDIDYINAHGTGTENNDETESRAMLRLFEKIPPFSSTKSFTGHTLGAAGAIEAVYAVLNIIHQEIYPSLSFLFPIPATGLIPVTHFEKRTLKHVMSNSFGFGGNCSTLIFSKT
jgi:3-oxoacyl-(acyl-carrier-protein) synthase